MHEINNDQRKYLIDTTQLYEAYRESLRQYRAMRYGLTWKHAKGRDYLFKIVRAGGYGESLGVRSSETEREFAEFKIKKQEMTHLLRAQHARLKHFARINKAMRLARVPLLVSKILRKLDARGAFDDEIMVMGTHCLYAYESMAGVVVDPSITASGDVDLLLNTNKSLSILASKLVNPNGILGILKSIDKTFRPLRPGSFRAINATEFMVDIIAPPSSIATRQSLQIGKDDLCGTEIDELASVSAAPRVFSVAIGEDGLPVPFVVPAPGWFAQHKRIMSESPGRDALKRPRDREQAIVVQQIVDNYLPHYQLGNGHAPMN